MTARSGFSPRCPWGKGLNCLIVQEALRARAARRFRALRSSSLRPPQTPESWLVSSAYCRQYSVTGQWEQTDLARSIWSTAGPVFPTGKKSSGSTFRHAAWSRQSIKNPSFSAVSMKRAPAQRPAPYSCLASLSSTEAFFKDFSGDALSCFVGCLLL